MYVIASYVAVILIWSTTPIAIKLSTDSLSPFAAITGRIVLAMMLMTLFVALCKRASLLKAKNWKIYLAASIGLFPNMLVVYMASAYIPTGMIAVIFALTPITSGLMASYILQDKFFSWERLLAFSVALSGLVIIFIDQLHVNNHSITGLVLMLISTLLFSLSQVMVKYYQRVSKIDAVEQTLGGLCFAVPGLLMSWVMLDGNMPHSISATSIYSLLYLVVMGSLVGFVAYFYVLSHLSVGVVSLIPLITPALALWLGSLILHESASVSLATGTAMIIFGLALYDGLIKQFVSRVRGVWF